MTPVEEDPARAGLLEVLRHLDLAEIVSYEHCARRVPRSVPDGDEAETVLRPELEAMFRHEAGEVEARFRMSVEGPGFLCSADVGLIYRSTKDDYELPRVLHHGFLTEIAVMAAYPFLREGIATSASRIGVPVPVLPLIKSGDVEFGEPQQMQPQAP